jgi:hypothetical protein
MSVRLYIISLLTLLACVGEMRAQSSTGTISGTVLDPNNAVVSGAAVTAKNTATGFERSSVTDLSGGYRLVNIPTGQYEITVEAPGFSKHLQSGVTLDTGQEAILDVLLKTDNIREVVTVNENASVLNTTTAEVSTRFDSRRISELPIATNRSVYNILLSAPGISQRTTGQTAFALGVSFSANGGRIRSNNFQLDGQDVNDPALGGSQMGLNNPDAIQEVRIITSQFMPEHGHNAGSVVEIVSRSGTNDFHGSAFWFHNNENLNACSNTDKRAGYCDPNATNESKRKAPYRRENQIGFTFGGPVVFPRFGEGDPYFYKGKDRTFFFTDYQQWSDRRTPSLTIRGAPTEAGRTALRTYADDLDHVRQFLRFVPAGIPNGRSVPVTVNGSAFSVPLGDLTSSSDFVFDSDQGSVRIDHSPDGKNSLYARYRYSFESTRRAAQITPPGHGTVVDLGVHALEVVWVSAPSSAVSNEARAARKRLDLTRDAEEASSYTIPAVEIVELGMVGGPEAETRTAFGLATNLPVFRTSGTYQLADALSVVKGEHVFKFGVELRRTTETSALFSLNRGNLVYRDLNSFVNDVALSGSQGLPLAGSDVTQDYRWYGGYFYAQDRWSIFPNLTLSYGIRYEYPGDTFKYLREVNERILAANGNHPDFIFGPYPKTDTNNWMPRVGLNWSPKINSKGVPGFITGGDKLVVRLGYARAYDPWMVNINQNIYTTFPFTATRFLSGSGAYNSVVTSTVPVLSMPRQLTRVIVPTDFRSPAMDQISFDVQRELSFDLLLRVGYIRTRGTGLFQSVQGNPAVPCLFGAFGCNATGIDRATGASIPVDRPPEKIDRTRGIVTIRGNTASSTYDALQVSLEKRMGRGFSFAMHYTWSTLIDTASDIFSPSVAEAGVPQDPFDWNADRGRGSYDRPHRLSGNFVYDLPFFSKQKGIVGKLLGGWQVNSFFSLQSGAPFSPLNGSDPTGANNPLRPNVFTNLDVSNMTVAELYLIDQQLRAQAHAQAHQIYDGMIFGPGRCLSSSWLPGPPLPFTLFSAPRGRIVCNNGVRSLEIIFNGILEGQRVGNAGRNILRADGLKLVDIGIIKNTQLTENLRVQFWTDFFNAFNERNFGIPSGVITAADFLDQWATDGGSRRIRFGARLVF